MALEFAILEIARQLNFIEATLVEKDMQRKLSAMREIEALHEISEYGWQLCAIERRTVIGQPDLFYLQREATEWVEE